MVLSFVFHFVYHCKAFLEVVPLEPVVGECAANAVFAETGAFDACLAQQVQCRRRDVAVALEFNDCYALQLMASVALQVMETEVEVNGQSLALAVVDQRDAAEPVFNDG